MAFQSMPETEANAEHLSRPAQARPPGGVRLPLPTKHHECGKPSAVTTAVKYGSPPSPLSFLGEMVLVPL